MDATVITDIFDIRQMIAETDVDENIEILKNSY